MIKVLKKIFDLVFILLIVILCLYFVLRSTNQLMIYSVETGSMENNIHAGDYILIMKQKEYVVGDVVTYKEKKGYITHRIIREEGDTIITKGDANNVEDEEIDKDSIVGKVMISGGIMNIIIKYKYSIIGLLLSLYLFSCYFASREDTEETKIEKEEIN